MSFSSLKGLLFDPAKGLDSRPTQQPRHVCTWSAHAPQYGPLSRSPFPLSFHTLTTTASASAFCELFLFGGYERGRESSDLHVISSTDFTTTLLKTSGEVPAPRGEHNAALIGTTLLICGGKTSSADQHPLNHDSLYLLNLSSRKWSRVLVNGPGPNGRYSYTTTVVGSKLFAFGGRIGEEIFNDMWTLDLNCLKSQLLWEPYDPTPGNKKPLPRYGHVLVTIDDSIIIFGGYGDQHYYNDTWSFDISTRTWTEVQCTGSIPSPRAGHAAVLVDDAMYVFGGFTGKTYSDDLIALQLSTQRWFKFHNEGSSPCGRAGHAMASVGTRVFVLGGASEEVQEDDISPINFFDTKHIKYPERECNAADPNGKITLFSRKSSTESGLERQLSASLAAQTELHRRIARLTEELERAKESAAQQNGQYEKELASLRAKQDVIRLRLTDAEKCWTSLNESVVSRDKQAGQYEMELTKVRAKLEAQGSELETVRLRLTDAEKGRTSLNELVVSRDQQAGQYEMELTKVRTKLEAQESELEAVRSRLTDAEKGLTKSTADADTLRAKNAAGSVNRDEDQVILSLMERVRAIEAEMVTKRSKEKFIEWSNEG